MTAPANAPRPVPGEVLLDVQDLRTLLTAPQGSGMAIDGASFRLRRGETLGLVGESGSGKSMTALSILRILPRPAASNAGGRVLFDGVDLLGLPEAEMRGYRGRRISMILQDPLSALNPVLTVGEQLMEPLRRHVGLRGAALRERAVELLSLLRVPAPRDRLRSYPHEFSGGMRQRVVGAIALACNPQMLIADEPTTSLDVTVQAQYLRLLRQLQRETGLAILFITHDFGIVARMCDRVAVMYAGRIVETAATRTLFQSPMHPYTEALLRSVPEMNVDRSGRLQAIDGQPPAIFARPPGCPFADRCRDVMPKCRDSDPGTTEIGPDRTVRCWKYA
ncbi:ABC transporter ATP-binding protein [Stella sp.]|uniref:ABC transporter ATP-binding protein n=1 Tax=Stella sp. TaxID=2912054 RepID=UPI0035B10F98